jgi:C4-dicarboxylate-specific signal transduction histidine kinase
LTKRTHIFPEALDALAAQGAQSTQGRELAIESEVCYCQRLISVHHTGFGLPPDQAEHIFDAFFTTKGNGTGKGLPISRSIIESRSADCWPQATEDSVQRFISHCRQKLQ